MKYSLAGIILLIFVCSCSSLKRKKTVQLSRDTLHTERQWQHEEEMLEHRKQEGYKVEKGKKNTMVFFADDVFYWDPDSGLLSRKGNVKVKIKLEQMDKHFSLQYRDTTLVKTTGSFAGQAVSTSGSLTATENVSERNKDFTGYWKLMAFGVLLVCLLGFYLRIIRR